jgi:hypothetical protein
VIKRNPNPPSKFSKPSSYLIIEHVGLGQDFVFPGKKYQYDENMGEYKIPARFPSVLKQAVNLGGITAILKMKFIKTFLTLN